MKVLFVCLGNICRSPAAENIFNHYLRERAWHGVIECDSAGTSSYHLGSPPDRRMADSLKKRGYSVQGQARQFSPEDFETFDLILAMDRDNYRDILRLDRDNRYGHKVKLMADYAQNFADREVPDPYYGGQDGFNYVIDLLEDGCHHLLQEIQSSPSTP